MLYYTQWQFLIICVHHTVWNDTNDHGWWSAVKQEYRHYIMIFCPISDTHSVISNNSVICCSCRHPCFVFEGSWVWVLSWKLVDMEPYKLSYSHFNIPYFPCHKILPPPPKNVSKSHLYLNTRRKNCREVFMSLYYLHGVFSLVLSYEVENIVIFTSSFMSFLPLPPMLKSIISLSSQFYYQTFSLSCTKFLYCICKQDSGHKEMATSFIYWLARFVL